jgi:glucose/arabinose dehydrogenase
VFHRLFLFVAFSAMFCMAHAATLRPGYDMDYGSALAYTVQLGGTNDFVGKGVTVTLRAGTNIGAVLFDTETLRYAAGWTDGWLDLSKTHLATYKGELPPRLAGKISFTTPPGPGWARNGSFIDPRTNGLGPLPREWAHYRGFYRHGSNVIFSYTVGNAEVLDMPGLIQVDGELVFTRTIQVNETRTPLTARMTEFGNSLGTAPMYGSGTTVSPLNATDLPRDHQFVTDLRALTRGGPAQWQPTLTTSGRRGADSGPFALDTVAIPEKNPWNSWMRLTALDFFSDGRAAVTTWNGDVWIVSNLNDDLKQVQWKRFAAGLFDPLGLKILRDEIFVLERHQITRLHDLNGDGEADFYENFNHDAGVSPSYHAFAMDLQTDRAGNFYYTRAGQRVDEKYPLNGGMVRVSADGSRAELFAHGLRAANGLGIGPNDEIVCSDNQGNWIPSSRINMIQRGGFYGYVPHAHTANAPKDFAPPLCWLPMALDNSSGGQVFVTGEGWPRALTNHLLHTSYGRAALFDVLWETVDGVTQGGVVKLPLRFDSGIQRARFNPHDGQLWVAGLKGWQTDGVKDGALQRVRYTGQPLRMPTELHIRRDGIEITFSDPLDRATAEDLQNFSAEQWNYRWTEKYGSDDYSVTNPEKKGRDVVNVRAARLSADGRRVLLEIPNLQPVMQMKIRFALKTTEAAPVAWEIHHTINRVPR